ncbi:unnamed protein product [Closterium sp. NIES-54]
MALRPSSVPLRVPLPPPLESSLPALPDPESDRARAARPTVSCLLATVVTDPSFESTSVSALVAELLDFAVACRLDYATALVAEFESAGPPSVGDPDAPDIATPCSYAEAITGPYSSRWQTAMDAEMASWKSTGTCVDEVPPPGANIVDGMWIFRVKRLPGSPPAFKARYVARGFCLRQGVDYFQTFFPTQKMNTLQVLLHVAAQRDYELHSLDFSTAFLQGSLHEEIWLRRPPGFTGSFLAGTKWRLWRLVYRLCQAPREWHDTLRTTLAALGFAPATANPSLFLRTDTSLLSFYVLVYVDNLVFATADTEALTLVKSELQKRHTCTDLGELRSYLGLQITWDSARRTITMTQSHMVHQVLKPSALRLPVLLATAHFSVYRPLALSSTFGRVRRAEWPVPRACGLPHVHWDAAKRVLHYLCSTSGMGLVLGGRGPVFLTDHTGASKVDDAATQRSLQGYTFSLAKCLCAGATGGTGLGGASTGVPGVGRAGGAGTGGGADTRGTTGGTTGGTRVSGASRQKSLSPLQLCEWAVHWGSPSGGAGGTGSRGAAATGAGGSGGATTQPQLSALRHLLSLLSAATEFPVAGTTPPLLFPLTDQSQPQLLPGSPLPAPAPHTEVTASLTGHCEPETRASTPEHREPESLSSVLARVHRVPRPRAPAVPGTHDMTLRPSSVPQSIVLPSPPASSLPHVPGPESDLVRVAGPTVTCLLATVVTDPSFESAAAGELALGCDVLEDRQFEVEYQAATAPHLASTLLCPEGDLDALDIPTPRTYAEAITGPYSSQWQTAMDVKMASWKSTGT